MSNARRAAAPRTGGAIAAGATLWAHRKRYLAGEITLEEYLELSGKAGLKGAFTSGVTGVSVYAITNLTPLQSAPLAGAAVKATIDTGVLLNRYRRGEIDGAQLVVDDYQASGGSESANSE